MKAEFTVKIKKMLYLKLFQIKLLSLLNPKKAQAVFDKMDVKKYIKIVKQADKIYRKEHNK